MLGGEVLCAIEGDQNSSVQDVKALDGACREEGVGDGGEHREEAVGRHTVQERADLVIAGDLGDAEQAVSVADPFGLAKGLLMGEKGRGLGEEDSEGAKSGVLDGIGRILAAPWTGNWSSVRCKACVSASNPRGPAILPP